MAAQISLSGSLMVDGDPCSVACGSGNARDVRSLGLAGCSGAAQSYDQAVSGSLRIATLGSIGDAFADLDLLRDLAGVEFLYVRSSARIRLRIGALAATLLGAGASFAAAASTSITLTVDGVSVPVTFDAADDTLTECVRRINAAAALVGLAPIASEDGGQIRLTSPTLGPASSLTVPAGAPATALGFDGGASAEGDGEDVDVAGLAMLEFPRYPDAPARILASGVASLEIVAAGRAA